MFADPFLPRDTGIFVQHRYRQHARQYMRGRSQQDRRDFDRVETRRRHAERAGRDPHEGADRRHDAGKEHCPRTPAVEERFALHNQAGIIRQRPDAEYLALGSVSDPEGRPVAE